MIQHNVDVKHIEKNVFDNVFNMVLNFDEKTKAIHSHIKIW